MSYEDTAVLLLSHGSTLPYAEEVFKKICAKFKAKTDFDAEVGYMKVAKPNLPQAIKILKERNPNLKRIIATPVFLAAGIHTNIDIPIILGLEPKETDPRQPDGIYPEGHYLYGLEEVDFDGEIRVFTIVSFEISIPVYLSTKLLSKLKFLVSYLKAYSSVSEETTFTSLSISRRSLTSALRAL